MIVATSAVDTVTTVTLLNVAVTVAVPPTAVTVKDTSSNRTVVEVATRDTTTLEEISTVYTIKWQKTYVLKAHTPPLQVAPFRQQDEVPQQIAPVAVLQQPPLAQHALPLAVAQHPAGDPQQI
jgi:hypothetical protein